MDNDGVVLLSDFRKLAKYYLSLMEGDDLYVEDAYKLLYEYDIVDEG